MASSTNALQDLLDATAEGVPPNGEVLNQLASALQALHLDSTSLGACHFNAGGQPRCYNLTREGCSLIPGSTFDPARLCVVHGTFTGPVAAAMGYYLWCFGLDPRQPETCSELLFALHL